MHALALPTDAASLDEVLAHHARLQPEALALVFEAQVWTYAAFHRRVAVLAEQLQRAHGVAPGDRVVWLGLNHPDILVLLFALARLGAVLVPLNYRLAPAEWGAVCADCGPSLVVHDAAWAQAAQALAQGLHIPAWSAHGLVEEPADGRSRPSAPSPTNAPVLLGYTSGTTGAPKGAVHTQGNLLANMRMAQQGQGMTSQDRVLTVLPLFHVGGLCLQTLPALYAGAMVILHARFDAATTLSSIANDLPTLTLQVPATMKALLEHPDWAGTCLDSLRAVWAGSSTLPQDLVDAFHARSVPVCNVYGATETGPFSVALDERHAMTHPGSCGWPALGVTLKLIDAQAGVGELCLRASNVVRHYWPDIPAVDAEGWFHSGDLARQASDGSWCIVGRAKDMIISGGENIYPAEIEGVLASHPDVAECAIVGLPDAQWGEAVVAVLVLRTGHHLDVIALGDFLAARLARYKLPRRYVVQAALPKTALGKVQKAQLRQAIA